MIGKEARQILRDPSSMLIAFVLPPILLFLFGFAVNLDTARARIGLAVLDQSDAARNLSLAYQRSRWFAVSVSSSVEPLKDHLVAGRIRGLVVIPQDFGRQVAAGGGDVQVITDGSSPNTASFVAAYAEGVRAAWARGRSFEHGSALGGAPITLIDRYWYNPELRSRNFLVPGAMAIVLTIIGTLLTALVIAREWERGTMEAIMATPVSMAELIVTKVVPYYMLGLGSAFVCALLATTLFGVPFRGSALALFLIVSAFLFPALGQGLLISAATKNQFVASQIALLTAFMPSLLLSGFLFEIDSMPKAIQWLTFAVPVRYLLPLLQSVFLAGDIWDLFLGNIAIMIGFGLVFFMLTMRATKRRIA
jgi:ABC-2 type transport system permease protein